eukprot:scaffold2865_cov69-Phaeocystis_antarctica.AAC.2
MPISNLVECAVNLAEKVAGVDIDRDGDVGQRTSNESGAVTSSTVMRSFVAVEETLLPVFDAATPKVSILAIGKNTLDSANELLVEAEKQAAEFQPQATLKADFMLNNYLGAGSTGLTTKDLTTGIADWKMDDGSSAPTTDPNASWYKPTGEGKWLGNGATGEANKVYGYTLSFEVNPPLPFQLLTSTPDPALPSHTVCACRLVAVYAQIVSGAQAYCFCFQVTAPQVASFGLAFAADNIIESATLNGKPLTVKANPTEYNKLEGKMDAGSALFKLGTNTLVVKVRNSGTSANPYGFYAEGTAITGAGAVSSCPRAQRVPTASPDLRATLHPRTSYIQPSYRMQYVNPLQAKCTLANATGARLEFLGSKGLLSEYKPPPILEPGAVASFLVDKASFALQYNIQVFQGPSRGWMRPGGKSITLTTTDRSAEIEADVQVVGANPRGPPAMYPTKFSFDLNLVQTSKSTEFDVLQIMVKQQITQTPRPRG